MYDTHVTSGAAHISEKCIIVLHMNKYVKVERRTLDLFGPDKSETSPMASFAQKQKGLSGLQQDYKNDANPSSSCISVAISNVADRSRVNENKQIKIEGSSITSHMLISTLLFVAMPLFATRLRLCLCVYESIFSAMVAVIIAMEYNGCG